MTEQNEDIINLGPLAPLAGIWEGDQGIDIAPSPNRDAMETPYRERLVLEPIGQVNNHEQSLYGLRYSTMAFRIGEDSAFHEENGYWLWDGDNQQVLRCYIVPRGYSVVAGGTAEVDAKQFQMVAELGSETYGICSNKYIAEAFKTVRFDVTVTVHDQNSFSYEQDSVIQIIGVSDLFHHTDKNTLHRVG
ncbi:MAG: heme-binding beta-barrel domain-containing protein [Gammaproteobacteria bacterium]